jgi:hypothetical protein
MEHFLIGSEVCSTQLLPRSSSALYYVVRFCQVGANLKVISVSSHWYAYCAITRIDTIPAGITGCQSNRRALVAISTGNDK